ncbi:hypothetical protein G5I_04113 [Acromyrmex echinatior]|uniref:Uncharacterized protein n=1 Tax=Acromyrmex echinatior TaxID=103372 RepID=F4WES2_ACREC|nr:hypothetical protein G5I_04113 [Acromyrmex echinatior]
MTTDDISTHDIVQILEKNVNILKSEGHGPDVTLEFYDKFELFRKLLCNLTDKLQSLLYLSENYTSTSDFKQFINRIVGSWNSINKQLRQYIAILKLNPFLVKLESDVDTYVSNINISPIDKSKCPKLDVFPIVAKLLTGELLDDEPIDPCCVLADNVPRKPVFIIKIKHKMDPSMIVEETI